MVLGLFTLAILTRLLPHPPNFAPITSIALFSGFYFENKRFAILFPLVCMLVTDIYLGLHSLMPVIYGCFVINTYIGIKFKKLTFTSILLASFSFFIVSNLGVWFFHYPLTFSGLLTCFTLAVFSASLKELSLDDTISYSPCSDSTMRNKNIFTS